MAALEQINGTDAGRLFKFTSNKLVIGRSEECCIVLTIPAVSRRHCEVWTDSDSFYLRDLGSRNQTVLNDRKVVSDELLVDGDQIRVSTIRFRFLAQDSLSQETGTWGNRPGLITIERAEDEAEEEKSVRRRLVKTGQQITNDELGSGHLNAVRIVARLDVADSSGGWPVINEAPVKLNQILQLLHTVRRMTTADEILGRSLKFLFDILPLAQNIAVVFRTDDYDGIRVGAAVSRHPTEEVQICIPMIRQAMQNREAVLYADHWNSETDADPPAGQLKSIMVCPLNSTSMFCSGAIQVDCTAVKQGFAASDLEYLAVLAHAISVLIEQASEFDDRMQRQSLQSMQNSAIRLHESFQPTKAPSIPGFQLTHGLIARDTVCADLVDYVVFEDGRVGVLMIDCTDNSVLGSQDEAIVSRILSGALLETGKPAKAIRQLEKEITERSESEINGLQVCVLLIDPEKAVVRCCAAGYFRIYAVHNGQVSGKCLHEACGPPLGMGWQDYSEVEWEIRPEELLAAFSNGVLGVSDDRGRLLSANQFQKLLQDLADDSASSLPVSVCHRLRESQSSQLLLDDIAFTMLARTDEVLVTDEDAELLLESGTTTS